MIVKQRIFLTVLLLLNDFEKCLSVGLHAEYLKNEWVTILLS